MRRAKCWNDLWVSLIYTRLLHESHIHLNISSKGCIIAERFLLAMVGCVNLAILPFQTWQTWHIHLQSAQEQ